ncbi:archaellin/type IV pilin N-terminal domain-containing protein [Haloarchaeobius amylolyticus]|uniref:archaellin/type IV pilin N-terminal domain-containing protein n=1 Tax=Haloarchaeobius amylolyticus TaxID=1198296 RepID=UPI002270C51A|nr:archaellin/type IV pilin N-terminal domain-containing protein [Haloarchaeobius amylolyticus]
MFATITEDDGDRGQVGIGTLIIFIAMVLVAAVAAGVLINTAGLLESTASDTGQDAQSEVSNQISVVSASGTVGGNNVTGLNFTVMKSAGSGDIDLGDATVEYSTEDVSKTLTFADGAAAGADTFAVTNIDDLSTQLSATSNDIVLSNSSDRVVIQISPSSIGDELQEGEDATVRFVDQSGATTIYGVNVPDTISDEQYVAV